MFTKTHAKYIQSLHHKKFRDEYGVFFAEGPKVVPELLQGKAFVCTQLLATAPWLQQHNWVRQYQIDELLEIKDFELEKISALSQPNQVLAVFEQLPVTQPPAAAAGQVTIVLDGLQDPGNLGTIIRTADWFGVPLIICSTDCADRYNPKVVQSTMGSLGRVQVVYTDAAGWLAQQQLTSYATTLQGTPLQELTPFKEGIIIIGNESKGIRAELMALAHQKITISKKGGAESLNAAVALGVVLAGVVR